MLRRPDAFLPLGRSELALASLLANRQHTYPPNAGSDGK